MGTGFDCFNEFFHTANPAVPAQFRANRALLKSLMAKHWFVNYDKEWWHYTLAGEPFPDTYFDFPCAEMLSGGLPEPVRRCYASPADISQGVL